MITSPPAARRPGLDTLRALAVTLVVFHHYTLFVSGAARDFGWFGQLGWAGVDLFFALSGYLIGSQIFAAIAQPRGLSLRRFYARRLLRTLPNFYVVLALYYGVPGFAGDKPLLPLWQFLTFTQNIALEPGTAFSHAWSLCIEEQFYLLLPAAALLAAGWRAARRWAFAGLLLLVAAGMLHRAQLWHTLVDGQADGLHNYFRYIYYASLCRADALLAGVALALVQQACPQRWSRWQAHGRRHAALGLTVLAIAGALFVRERTGFAATVFGYPLVALGFALLILAALSERTLLATLRVPGAATLALWSYAIYLLHKQVCVLGAARLAVWGVAPASLLAVLLLIGASVLAGAVLFTLVERPFLRLRDRHVPTSLAPSAARLDHVEG